MAQYSKHLKQIATYWVPTGTDVFGMKQFTSPVTLKCRWEYKTEKILSKLGDEIVSNSKIFTESMLDLDGYLALGTFTELTPFDVQSAREIQQIMTIPDLRNLQTLYVTLL